MIKKLKSIMMLTSLLLNVLTLMFTIQSAGAVEPAIVSILNTLGFTNIAESPHETFPAGTYNVTLYGEFAGYHSSNELSWYIIGTTEYNLLFSGPEGNRDYIIPPIEKTFETENDFGLSFVSPEARYFTETAKNPDGIQHSIVFDNLDNPSMWLIGFENRLGGGDKDYQDMIIALEYVTPPPPTQYTLTITASTGGTTDPAPGSYPINEGEPVAVSAIPSSGYLFLHWEFDSEIRTENPLEFTMDKDLSVYAMFEPAPPPEIEATLDFEPDCINMESKCVWVAVYIELPEGYDVNDIDVSTILLNNTVSAIHAPLFPPEIIAQATSIIDYDSDSVLELKVGFDRAAVSEFLISQGVSYGNTVLTITGELNDGTLFKASAIVRVSQLTGDVDCDGNVDLEDLVLFAQAYRSKPGDPNYNPNASFAPPCDISLADFVTLAYHYGEEYK